MKLNPATTALVTIDLQKGIVALDTAPYTGADIVARTVPFIQRFAEAGATVVRVHVGWSADGDDMLRQPVDSGHGGSAPPAEFTEFAPEIAALPAHATILKRNWGAFHGTELDLQLRRRGIDTVVLCGIATNIGVEQTAREAWQHGYAVVAVRDLCTTFSAEMQDFSFKAIMPRIARVADSAEIELG